MAELQVNQAVAYQSISMLPRTHVLAEGVRAPSFGLYELTITDVSPHILHPLMPIDDADNSDEIDDSATDVGDGDDVSLDSPNAVTVRAAADHVSSTRSHSSSIAFEDQTLKREEDHHISGSSSRGSDGNSNGMELGSLEKSRHSGGGGNETASTDEMERINKRGEWRNKVIEEEKQRMQERKHKGPSIKKQLHIKKKVKKSDDWTIHHFTIVFPIPSKDPLLSHRKLYDFSQIYSIDGQPHDIENNYR